MTAKIITIGDEILVGQTIDTNSAFISQQLNLLGIPVLEILSIADTKEHIVATLDRIINDADLIIVTGGLGPTNDDVTKTVLTDYFEDELVIYPQILERIKAFFERFNKPFLDVNYQQAMLPKKATIIENDFGTASGMWFKKGKSNVISLPGVPFEMKGLMMKIIQIVKENYPIGDFYHQTLYIQGIGESYLAEKIKDWEKDKRDQGISVSYLPSVGLIKLRLTGNISQKEIIEKGLIEIKEKYPEYVFGYDDKPLEQVIGNLLINNKKTLGTIESCTGGAIAKLIVSVPGSSAYFEGSLNTYSNRLKIELAGVNPNDISKVGAVSQEVAEQMAKNGREKLGVDYCISTTGIAGPDGGSIEKPVGTVWIGIATPNKVYSKKFQFGHDRNKNIESTVLYALNFLRRIMLDL